jgi:hypothetical protein
LDALDAFTDEFLTAENDQIKEKPKVTQEDLL